MKKIWNDITIGDTVYLDREYKDEPRIHLVSELEVTDITHGANGITILRLKSIQNDFTKEDREVYPYVKIFNQEMAENVKIPNRSSKARPQCNANFFTSYEDVLEDLSASIKFSAERARHYMTRLQALKGIREAVERRTQK